MGITVPTFNDPAEPKTRETSRVLVIFAREVDEDGPISTHVDPSASHKYEWSAVNVSVPPVNSSVTAIERPSDGTTSSQVAPLS
jgi:hypothetical protein